MKAAIDDLERRIARALSDVVPDMEASAARPIGFVLPKCDNSQKLMRN
jgi:hypothetical protein